MPAVASRNYDFFRKRKLPQSKPDGFASSLGEGASGVTGRFAVWMESFCLPSACKDAPLGQRQGGVFRLPPPYLWTPPTPQRAKGCSPLTNLKKKSKHKKASAAPVGAIALTLFFASPSIAPQSLRDRFPFLSPAVTSSPGRGKSALSGERAPAPSAALSQKAALQMPFAVTTSPVKMGFRKVRRLS